MALVPTTTLHLRGGHFVRRPSMRVSTTCLITAALGATGSLGTLYDGPNEVLNRTYDFIIVGGTSSYPVNF